MSLDRVRLQTAFAPQDQIEVRVDHRAVVFVLPGEPSRQVWWRISDSELASLVTKLSQGARAAYGRGGDGFSMLVTRLQEELLTFDGDRGEVVINGRDLTVEPR